MKFRQHISLSINIQFKLYKIVIFLLLVCINATDVAGQESSGCLELKNYEEQEPRLKAALESNIASFGKSDPIVLRNQSELAGLYQELGQYNKAKDLMKRNRQTSNGTRTGISR